MPPTNRLSPPRLPLTPEALDLKGRTRALYRDLTVRPEFREAMARRGLKERLHQLNRVDGRRGAEVLASEVVDFIAAGATAGEIEELLSFISRIAEDAFLARDGGELPTLLEAECAEDAADVEEDATQTAAIRVLSAGKHLTTAELEERLRVCRRQHAHSSVLVRVYECELRRRALGQYDRTQRSA